MSAADLSLEAKYPEAFRTDRGARLLPLLVVAGIALYVVYAVWFFQLPAVLGGAKWDRLGNYLGQWISYDVSAEYRLDGPQIIAKWPRFSPLGATPKPDWIRTNGDGSIEIDLAGNMHAVTFTQARATLVNGTESVAIDLAGDGPIVAGSLPKWAELKGNEIVVDYGFDGEIRVGTDRVKFRKRILGWSNFVFDQLSPFFDKPAGEVIGLIILGPDVKQGTPNWALAFDNIWYNSQWQHGDVWTKLLQTIVMAFAGTLIGALIAFPLAFFAARNITPNGVVNHSLKRFFDFLRSVDMLIWALFFTRGFGPGPLAGIGAIALTETGTLGKVYSEGLENIDDKQREGIKSTGADPIAIQRYGVVPQVLPIMISQTLYQWESNTRSATIIGAVGAGGIGLKLWEAMRTNSNWSNVFYMVLLILFVVFIFDNISNALRSRLIGNSN
ncbi:MAG: phosphonate ABC transporter, permease protein PhnE [Devosia sp.]